MPSSSFPSSFASRPGRNSQKEETREALLEKVKAERAQRNESRQRSKSAVVIQRYWRGWKCRLDARKAILMEWKQKYAGAVSNVSTAVPASQLLGHAVPAMLFCMWSPKSTATQRLLKTGQQLQLEQQLPQAVPVVKGTLALLIRSIAAADPASNYCSFALQEHSMAQWQWQATRLLQLCSCLISMGTPTSPDPLLDAASARVIHLLLDASQWKFQLPPADTACTPAVAIQSLCVLTSRFPLPLFCATCRVLTAVSSPPPSLAKENVGSSPSSTSDSATVASLTPTPPSLVPQRLLSSALALLSSCSAAVLKPFSETILTIPGCDRQLPDSFKSSLLSLDLSTQLLQSLQQLAASKALSAAKASAAAGNIISMLGVGTTSSSSVGGTSRRMSIMLSPSAHLASGLVAVWYWKAVGALVTCTCERLKALSGSAKQEEAAAVAAEVIRWWPLGDRVHLQQLLTVLEKFYMPSDPQQQRSKASEDESMGMVQFAQVSVQLLLQLPQLQSQLASTLKAPHPFTPADVPSLLNTLAFSPNLLPRLWHWLAFNLGLPLEAPVEATRGLDIVNLAGGFSSLVPSLAAAMGLFCRVLQHLLLVLDDTEFYEQQQPFTLGQSRAIATSLNSLVLHTFFPTAGLAAGVGPQGARGGAYDLLAEYAPLSLRALYERDVRRPFCQPELWVAPYTALTEAQKAETARRFGGQGGVRIIGAFNAEAVVAVLTGREEEDEGQPALQAEQGAGRRPASLAALLRVAPQCVPFTHRVELFRVLLGHIKAKGGYNLPPAEGGPQPIQITIHRDALMDDAFAALFGRGLDLQRRLVVSFVNAAGMLEAGLDQGGLMKEFLEQVVSTGLGGGYGLFQATGQGLAYPCPTADRLHMGLQLLEFLGLIVGKALFEGILLEAAFAPFFVSRLQGRSSTFDDLLSLDPSIHRSLTQVKRYDGDVEDLGLTFTAEDNFFGQTISHELLPGRGSQPVTNANRLLYVHLLADWHLNSRLGSPAEAFARGLSSIIPITSLRLFNPYEFNELISGGSDGGVDVDDMRQYVKYSGGYSESSTTIRLFWKVVAGMSLAERSALLKFVTSCSRAPLGGFKHLQPPLTIHKVDCDASLLALVGGKDVDRLPSASTCYNMLKLPNYRRASTMKEKLAYAIGSGAGFELS